MRPPGSRPSPAEAGARALRLALVLALVAAAAGAVIALVVFPTGSAGHDDHPITRPSTHVPPSSGPGLRLPPPPAAPAVLASADDAGPPVSVAGLKKHLSALLTSPGLGKHLAFTVAQLGMPSVRWSPAAQTTMPASTLKLLTTTAALAALGPDHHFTTQVLPGASRRSIVLVGGGDPLLAASAPEVNGPAVEYPRRASLEELANQAASRLLSSGVRRVRLGYDASLFSGPAVNPRWPATYVADNVVSPITALWADEGRDTAGLAPRSPDPALAAAETFRGQLTDAGITVLGAPTEQRAPRAGRPLAVVESAPLVQIVQHILEQSDNEGAEVLLRQVAVSRGLTGSSANGVRAVRATLTGLGLQLRGAQLYDGSGLSRDDVIPVSLLLDTLELTATDAHPELRGVLTGLPVAGFSGSLGYRFEHGAGSGRGYVRAKTGTLTGVHGLAGIAMTRAGQELLFVAVADRVPVPLTLRARADLDRIAAALTTCGC